MLLGAVIGAETRPGEGERSGRGRHRRREPGPGRAYLAKVRNNEEGTTASASPAMPRDTDMSVQFLNAATAAGR